MLPPAIVSVLIDIMECPAFRAHMVAKDLDFAQVNFCMACWTKW